MNIPIFGQLHALSFLIPAAVGIIRFAKLDRAMKTLAVLAVLACINITAQLLAGLAHITNYFISDYFRVVELSLLCMVFYLSIVPRRPRLILKLLGIFFVLIWLADMLIFYDPDRIDSGMAVISRVFLIIMSVLTLHAAVKDEKSSLLKRPVFWAAMGVALYATGTLLVLGVSNQLLKAGMSYFAAAWHINWSLLIVANLLYTKGMLCKSQL
jgi:hypothetical protein